MRILDDAGVFAASEFWDETRQCLRSLAVDEIDRETWEALFAPQFKHSCLNRLQLRDTRQMVDLTDQVGSLQFAGTLPNPLAPANAPAPHPGECSDRIGREKDVRNALVDNAVGGVS